MRTAVPVGQLPEVCIHIHIYIIQQRHIAISMYGPVSSLTDPIAAPKLLQPNEEWEPLCPWANFQRYLYLYITYIYAITKTYTHVHMAPI